MNKLNYKINNMSDNLNIDICDKDVNNEDINDEDINAEDINDNKDVNNEDINAEDINAEDINNEDINDNNMCVRDEKIKPITLYDYQISHKDNLINILKHNPYAIDLSMMGSGKTYVTGFIFQNQPQYKYIINISPVSVKTKWNQVKKENGINLYKSISFSGLIGRQHKQPKHGLLNRNDYTHTIKSPTGEEKIIEKCTFTCTQEYLNCVEEGVLLVIDEIQHIKNVNMQSDACKTLILPIINSFTEFKDAVSGNSRIILLSGSPIDKKCQVINLFKTLNIMKSDRLTTYNPSLHYNVWRGMYEIEQYCTDVLNTQFQLSNQMNYNPIHTISYLKRRYINPLHHNISSAKLENYCYALFQEIIKKYLSSQMTGMPCTTKIHKRNAYYWLNDKNSIDILYKGITLLEESVQYNHANKTIDFGHNGSITLRSIQKALYMIETSKLLVFIRVTRESLEKNKNQKVVIGVNYTASISTLYSALQQYNPLILDGSTSSNQRINIINKFQEPSTSFRLLIGNISVISCGIDLDDKYGTYPRICYISPNYRTIDLYQLGHRFIRADTRSDSIIHNVLCHEYTEVGVLDAIARKGNIMKEITDKQTEYGIIFPGEYDNYFEPKLTIVN